VCKRSRSIKKQYNTYGYPDSYDEIGSTQLDDQFDKKIEFVAQDGNVVD
jgi:hypothetical protein